MRGDGTSEFYAAVMITGIISLFLLIVGGVATWLHVRHEAKKDAECAAWGGVRVEASKDYCIRQDVVLHPKANRRYGCEADGECR